MFFALRYPERRLMTTRFNNYKLQMFVACQNLNWRLPDNEIGEVVRCQSAFLSSQFHL
jgi:hypothetical protein